VTIYDDLLTVAPLLEAIFYESIRLQRRMNSGRSKSLFRQLSKISVQRSTIISSSHFPQHLMSKQRLLHFWTLNVGNSTELLEITILRFINSKNTAKA